MVSLFSVDVCFLIDATGSMGSLIRTCTDKIFQIAQHLKKAYPLATFRFSLVAYRDFGDVPGFEVLPFTTDVNLLHQHLQQLTASGGNDTAEDVHGGLEEVAKLDWQSTTRCLAHFADAPGHGALFNGGQNDNHQNFDADGKMAQAVLNKLYQSQVQYKFFKMNGTTDAMIQKYSEYYTDSTMDTGFKLETLDLGRKMNLMLQSVVRTVSDSINDIFLNEKGAITNTSTGSAVLDLFFKTVRGIKPEILEKLLEAAWNENALDTLKILFYTRDCKEGKGERAVFIESMKWLIKKDSSVFLKNIHLCTTDIGRWADLMEFMDDEIVGEQICQMFADQLKKDLVNMNEGKSISLCAKWIPSEKCKYDKSKKGVKRIAGALGVNKAQYRKLYVSPLRAYMHVVERYMSLQKWDAIDYSKVPSIAMNNLKNAFQKHDATRFAKFMEQVTKGEKKINVATLQPYEILKPYFDAKSTTDAFKDQQWKAFTNKIEKQGSLRDSVVVLDVSESMTAEPLQAAVSLGLLISELSNDPYRNKIITFSENPTFHDLEGLSIRDKVQQICKMHCDDGTSIAAVFDLLLETAVKSGARKEDMPETIYIISDMQFEQADATYNTNHHIIKSKFEQAGYNLPKIVYWNVRANTEDFNTKSTEQGVSLVSGFSANIFKQLVSAHHDATPFEMMRALLDDPRYAAVTL